MYGRVVRSIPVASLRKEAAYLEENIDAGSMCVLSKWFIDAEVSFDVQTCRECGINVSIISGIMSHGWCVDWRASGSDEATSVQMNGSDGNTHWAQCIQL